MRFETNMSMAAVVASGSPSCSTESGVSKKKKKRFISITTPAQLGWGSTKCQTHKKSSNTTHCGFGQCRIDALATPGKGFDGLDGESNWLRSTSRGLRLRSLARENLLPLADPSRGVWCGRICDASPTFLTVATQLLGSTSRDSSRIH